MTTQLPPPGGPRPSLDAVQAAIEASRPLPWRTIGLVASGALAVSAFLPWVTMRAAFVGEASARGTEGDGVFFIAAAAVVAFAFARRRALLAVIGAALTVAGVFVEWLVLTRHVARVGRELDGFGTASIGVGLWLAAVAAVVALVAAAKAEAG